MTSIAATTGQHERACGGQHPRAPLRALHRLVIWGVVVGVIQAASPLGFWWLAPKTVYALGLTLIAAVYIGFSVADGRGKVIAIESCVAPFCATVDWVTAGLLTVAMSTGVLFHG